MRRIIGPILGVLGILAVFGLVAGAAYSAGLAAAGVVAAPGTTVVAPVAAYGWYGVPWFGFGFFHFLALLFVVVLIIGLIRLAIGGGRRGRGYGWGYGHGYGPSGWDRGHEVGDHPSSDPREAWIRARLDEWHRTAHATTGSAATGPAPAPADATGQEPPHAEG